MRQSTFSPTAGGLLTGAASPSHKQEINAQGEEEVCAVAASLAPIAAELGCTVAQLAIAWVVRNPDVAVCVFGKPQRAFVRFAAASYHLKQRCTTLRRHVQAGADRGAGRGAGAGAEADGGGDGEDRGGRRHGAAAAAHQPRPPVPLTRPERVKSLRNSSTLIKMQPLGGPGCRRPLALSARRWLGEPGDPARLCRCTRHEGGLLQTLPFAFFCKIQRRGRRRARAGAAPSPPRGAHKRRPIRCFA